MNDIVAPTYTATARFDDDDRSLWNIYVTEDFGSHTSIVVSLATEVVCGKTDEPWTYLQGRGWRLTGKQRLIFPHGLERTVEPIVDAREAPLTGEQLIFVRRCRARGVIAIDALMAWREGDRDPDAVAQRLHRDTSMYTLLQAARHG